MIKVNSTNIAEVEWREAGGQGELDIKFHTGSTYRYFNVPEGIYQKLITADSIGKFFDIYIKKAGYRYEVLKEESSSATTLLNEADLRINTLTAILEEVDDVLHIDEVSELLVRSKETRKKIQTFLRSN